MMINYNKTILIYKNKLKKIKDEISNIKLPEKISFLKSLFIISLYVFIIWPIVIFLISSIFMILYLILGLILFVFFQVDITSEGTFVAEFIESILFPKGMISFWELLPWRQFSITFLIIMVVSIFLYVNNRYLRKKIQKKYNLLEKEKTKIEKELDKEIEKFEEKQKSKGLIKYKDEWTTPEKVAKWKEIELGIHKNFKNMSHFEFEEFIAKLFRKMGYEAYATSKTGDYGIDVIAKKEGKKIAIQCKQNKLGNNVGNVIVQNTLGSMWKIKADKSIIITTSDFTIKAQEQAKEAPIELWDNQYLKKMVRKYFIESK